MAGSSRQIDCCIAGGGPVGLALAAELGRHGIACRLIEQGDGVVRTPKMNEVNTRTMELCRRWGIADQVLDTPFPPDWPKDVVFVTSLAGFEMGRVPRSVRQQRASEASPESMQICSQHWFDPILQRFARSFPSVELSYGCRLESFVQHSDGVTATAIDTATGAGEEIDARYLIGCDGAASTVRRALGIGMAGQGSLGHAINMFFRAPGLIEACGKAPGTFFILCDAGGVWGNLRIIDPLMGLWRLMVNEAGADATPESIDRQGYLRRALGRDIAVDWVDVNVWHRRSLVAESYGGGRVLIAGDAVHLVSPTGALGMNTGMGDAVDLGWKLAAVLQGWGGPRLVDSYDAERRPVGVRNVRMATAFHGLHTGYDADSLAVIEQDSAEGARVRAALGERLVSRLGAEFRTIGLQIGYAYEDSPICVADGTPPAPDTPEAYHPSARPGARAPHVWLGDGRSILDLFGRGFVLLDFSRGATNPEPLAAAAAHRRLPLRVAAIDRADAARLYERALVLVRPDGHVAWRGDAPPADPLAVIDRVRGA